MMTKPCGARPRNRIWVPEGRRDFFVLLQERQTFQKNVVYRITTQISCQYVILLPEFMLFKKLRKSRYMPTGWPWRKVAQKAIELCIPINWDKRYRYWVIMRSCLYLGIFNLIYTERIYIYMHILYVVYVRNISLKSEITKYFLGLNFDFIYDR